MGLNLAKKTKASFGFALITPTGGITVNTARPIFDWEDAVDNVAVIGYSLTLTGSSPLTGSVMAQDATATLVISTTTITNTATVSSITGSGDSDLTNNSATDVSISGFIYLPVIFKNATFL